jgi:hypothetical protein
VPNDSIRRGMKRPGRRSEGRQWSWRPQRRPPEADGRRLHTEVGRYLAMDSDRLNFLTHILVRASHYRLSDGSATRDQPPAGEHDLPMRSACAPPSHGSAPPEAPLHCGYPLALRCYSSAKGAAPLPDSAMAIEFGPQLRTVWSPVVRLAYHGIDHEVAIHWSSP